MTFLRYGPVIGYYSGMNRTVVLSDYDVITEAFTRDDLSDRPCFKSLKIARDQDNERYVAILLKEKLKHCFEGMMCLVFCFLTEKIGKSRGDLP